MREDEGNEDGHTDGRAKDEDDEQGDDDLLWDRQCANQHVWKIGKLVKEINLQSSIFEDRMIRNKSPSPHCSNHSPMNSLHKKKNPTGW